MKFGRNWSTNTLVIVPIRKICVFTAAISVAILKAYIMQDTYLIQIKVMHDIWKNPDDK